MADGQPVCGECVLNPAAVGHCMAAVDYRYPWDTLIARFKFRSQPGWAPEMAGWMADCLRREGDVAADALLIPIPVSPRRLEERGYNQAWELCRALRRRTGLQALPDALIRLGDAPDQHRLPPAQRLTNLLGVFAVNPLRAERLSGKNVLLVDDVRTTGATLDQAARALRQVGCATVDALVLARALADADQEV